MAARIRRILISLGIIAGSIFGVLMYTMPSWFERFMLRHIGDQFEVVVYGSLFVGTPVLGIGVFVLSTLWKRLTNPTGHGTHRRKERAARWLKFGLIFFGLFFAMILVGSLLAPHF